MRKVASVFAALFFVLMTVTTAFANSQEAELFDALALSDGAETDAILSNLEKYFLQNPEEFLKKLNNQDENIRKIVVNNFAIWAIGEEDAAKQLAEVIEAVAENPDAEELLAVYRAQKDVEAVMPLMDALDVEAIRRVLFFTILVAGIVHLIRKKIEEKDS